MLVFAVVIVLFKVETSPSTKALILCCVASLVALSEAILSSSAISVIVTVPSDKDPNCTVPEPVMSVPSIAAALKSAAVIVNAPVLEPVKVPVPATTLSSDSSHPMNTLLLSPRSIIKPTSFDGVPVVPVASSSNESAIVVFVELTVVVLPLTVKSPVITASPLTLTVVAVISLESNDPCTSTLAALIAFSVDPSDPVNS